METVSVRPSVTRAKTGPGISLKIGSPVNVDLLSMSWKSDFTSLDQEGFRSGPKKCKFSIPGLSANIFHSLTPYGTHASYRPLFLLKHLAHGLILIAYYSYPYTHISDL